MGFVFPTISPLSPEQRSFDDAVQKAKVSADKGDVMGTGLATAVALENAKAAYEKFTVADAQALQRRALNRDFGTSIAKTFSALWNGDKSTATKTLADSRLSMREAAADNYAQPMGEAKTMKGLYTLASNLLLGPPKRAVEKLSATDTDVDEDAAEVIDGYDIPDAAREELRRLFKTMKEQAAQGHCLAAESISFTLWDGKSDKGLLEGCGQSDVDVDDRRNNANDLEGVAYKYIDDCFAASGMELSAREKAAFEYVQDNPDVVASCNSGETSKDDDDAGHAWDWVTERYKDLHPEEDEFTREQCARNGAGSIAQRCAVYYQHIGRDDLAAQSQKQYEEYLAIEKSMDEQNAGSNVDAAPTQQSMAAANEPDAAPEQNPSEAPAAQNEPEAAADPNAPAAAADPNAPAAAVDPNAAEAAPEQNAPDTLPSDDSNNAGATDNAAQ